MGFLASQDAYTERFDAIIADVPRKSKCVDDTVMWDDNLEAHWWRVVDFLELVGSSGVVLNPTKFQFASTDVDFAGFRLTASEVKPLAKYIDAIKSFPRPNNISDVRAWFGLVNQVSQYGRTARLMAPFKPLLSPKTRFVWNQSLEDAFERSKTDIVKEIEKGVEIFDPARRTCLCPDWSTTGIGYWLHQKHCSCNALTPGCCPSGWRVTLAGSRFLRDAEKRYAPVEGEALAVAWSLEDSRFFTMGCHDLIIASDHKPLTKILGDRELADIQNPRLFRIKQRTMMWKYRLVHVPGRTIPASDATSRYPTRSAAQAETNTLAAIRIPASEDDSLETAVVAAARASTPRLGAVTWERVRDFTHRDGDLRKLAEMVAAGFPASRDKVPESLHPFWQFRDRLSTIDGVVMMDDRIVVPAPLRSEVLQALHAAHQGTSKMGHRAITAIFWPGISIDIETTRNRCPECWRMAPSHPPMPPVPPSIPIRPFQAIAADFCVARGTGYLVVVDRFSGWPHVVASLSGAAGFSRALVAYFATYGVPEELSTDGGPEFTAKDTAALLQRWGVRHRLSSAHHPQSNGRAEVAVKSMKRLLTSHTDGNGGLDTEAVAAGLLAYRNTPDLETGMSPAQIVFGRNLRDLLPVAPREQIFSSPAVHPIWRETWARQEAALRLRFAKQTDVLAEGTRKLPPLASGDTVLVQNQIGPHRKRWDRTGVVVETKPHDQYLVKIHGSGRITLRNRRYLRQIQGLGRSPHTQAPVPSWHGPPSTEPVPPAGPAPTPASDVRNDDQAPDTTAESPDAATSESHDRPISSPHDAGPLDPLNAEAPLPTARRSPIQSPQAPPRRSQRARQAPAYLRDYVCDV